MGWGMDTKSVLLIGFVFGLCMSANAAASMYAGCSGFTLQPGSPCAAVLAAVNCMFSLLLAFMTYKLISSA